MFPAQEKSQKTSDLNLEDFKLVRVRDLPCYLRKNIKKLNIRGEILDVKNPSPLYDLIKKIKRKKT